MREEMEDFFFGDRDRGGKGCQAYVDRLGIGPDQTRKQTGDERAAIGATKGSSVRPGIAWAAADSS
jgi:hypothetical protein